MDISAIEVALGLAVVAIAVYLAFSRGGSVSENVASVQNIAAEARSWVQIAEQLYASGQLPASGSAGEAKKQYVLDQLQRIFPKVPVETIEGSIELGVVWLKTALDDWTNKDE